MDTSYLLDICSSMKETALRNWKKVVSGVGLAVGIAVVATIYCCATSEANSTAGPCEAASSPNYEIPDTCPWQMVMSDLTYRLRLVEMAFKEQVIAREVIAAEVTNQSMSNLELEKRLEEFLTALRNLSFRLDKINDQMSELSSRLYSDECLGFLVLMFVVVEIILALRNKLHHRLDQGQAQGHAPPGQVHNGSTATVRKSLSNHSISGALPAPKPNVSFKHEVCVVTFSKVTWKQNASVAETLLSYVTDDARTPVRQYHCIDCQEELKTCPKARLYLALAESESTGLDGLRKELGQSYESECNLDLQLTFLKQISSSKGQVIFVIIKEEGSRELPSLSLYNTSLSLIQAHEQLQDLAWNGRLLTIWNDFSAHQLAHIKKMGKSLLNLKGK